MRCRGRHQDVPLDGALPRDPDVAGDEVAQPAVHQLGTPPAGAERPVVRLDEDDPEPARGRIEGRTGAGDATPDDEQVDRLGVGEGVEVAPPAGRVESGRAHGRRYPSSAWVSSRRQDAAGRYSAIIR